MSDDGTEQPNALAEVDDSVGVAKEGKGDNQISAPEVDDGSDASDSKPSEGVGIEQKSKVEIKKESEGIKSNDDDGSDVSASTPPADGLGDKNNNNRNNVELEEDNPGGDDLEPSARSKSDSEDANTKPPKQHEENTQLAHANQPERDSAEDIGEDANADPSLQHQVTNPEVANAIQPERESVEDIADDANANPPLPNEDENHEGNNANQQDEREQGPNEESAAQGRVGPIRREEPPAFHQNKGGFLWKGRNIYRDNPVVWPDFPIDDRDVTQPSELDPLPYHTFTEEQMKEFGIHPLFNFGVSTSINKAYHLLCRDRSTKERAEMGTFGRADTFKFGGVTCSFHDLLSLEPDVFVLDPCLEGMVQWYKDEYLLKEKFPDVTMVFFSWLKKYECHPTDFTPTPIRQGVSPIRPDRCEKYNYGAVRTFWRTKFGGKAPNPDDPKINPLSYEKIIFIYNVSHTHWFVIAIFPKKRVIESYDSLRHTSPDPIKAAYNWLRDECHDQGVDFPEDWKLHYMRPGVPKQPAGNNCGLFTLAFVHALMHGIDIRTLSVNNIQRYGRRFVFALMYNCWRKKKQGVANKPIEIVSPSPGKAEIKFRITYDIDPIDGRRMGPVFPDCPEDLNWTHSGCIWQLQGLCASGTSRCKSIGQTLGRSYLSPRCFCCGFACHTKCGFAVKLKGRQHFRDERLTIICFACMDLRKFKKEKKGLVLFEKDIVKLNGIEWQPLQFVSGFEHDVHVESSPPPVFPDEDLTEMDDPLQEIEPLIQIIAAFDSLFPRPSTRSNQDAIEIESGEELEVNNDHVSDGSSSHGDQLHHEEIKDNPKQPEPKPPLRFDEHWQDPFYCGSDSFCRDSGKRLGTEHRCIGCGLFCHKACGNQILCDEDDEEQVFKDPKIDYVCMKCQISYNIRVFLKDIEDAQYYYLTDAVKHVESLYTHGVREIGSVPFKRVNVHEDPSNAEDDSDEDYPRDSQGDGNDEAKSNDNANDENTKGDENDNEGGNNNPEDNKNNSPKDDGDDDEETESDKELGKKVVEKENTKKKKKKKKKQDDEKDDEEVVGDENDNEGDNSEDDKDSLPKDEETEKDKEPGDMVVVTETTEEEVKEDKDDGEVGEEEEEVVSKPRTRRSSPIKDLSMEKLSKKLDMVARKKDLTKRTTLKEKIKAKKNKELQEKQLLQKRQAQEQKGKQERKNVKDKKLVDKKGMETQVAEKITTTVPLASKFQSYDDRMKPEMTLEERIKLRSNLAWLDESFAEKEAEDKEEDRKREELITRQKEEEAKLKKHFKLTGELPPSEFQKLQLERQKKKLSDVIPKKKKKKLTPEEKAKELALEKEKEEKALQARIAARRKEEEKSKEQINARYAEIEAIIRAEELEKEKKKDPDPSQTESDRQDLHSDKGKEAKDKRKATNNPSAPKEKKKKTEEGIKEQKPTTDYPNTEKLLSDPIGDSEETQQPDSKSESDEKDAEKEAPNYSEYMPKDAPPELQATLREVLVQLDKKRKPKKSGDSYRKRRQETKSRQIDEGIIRSVTQG